MSHSIFYFAYGSNLDARQMQERCPGAISIGNGCLEGFSISFTRHSKKWNGGVADIIETPGGQVWGLVWHLSEENLESLDQFEGHPTIYRRKEMIIQMRPEKNVSAWVYEVLEKKPLIDPSDKYLEIILSSATAVGLPAEYTASVAKFGKKSASE